MLMRKEDSLLLIIDVQERLVTAMDNPREVINNCAHLVAIAEELGIEYLITEQYPKGLGQTIIDVRQAAKKADSYVEKLEFSCVKNATIMEKIKKSGKKQIIIAGVETHICVLQTALDLTAQGYEVFVVANACSSRQNLQHIFALQRMSHDGVNIVTYEMVVFEWLEKAGSDQFKDITRRYVI